MQQYMDEKMGRMKRWKLRIFCIIAVAVVISAFLIGYNMGKLVPQPTQPAEKSLEIVDDFGRVVSIKGEIGRIVSIAPSNTEILFALGVGDKVVGVTTYCNYPEEAKAKEKVGGYTDVSVEKVVNLKPDIVFASGTVQKTIVEKLVEVGITVVAFHPGDIESVYRSIKMIGRIIKEDANATKLVEKMRSVITNVSAKVENVSVEKRVKVYYELWNAPYWTAGAYSFINGIIFKAGGINIAGSLPVDYPTLSDEFIINANPDVIITTPMNADTPDKIKNRSAWQEIAAVKNNRVYLVDGDLIERPGPRIASGTEMLAKLFYPDLFR